MNDGSYNYIISYDYQMESAKLCLVTSNLVLFILYFICHFQITKARSMLSISDSRVSFFFFFWKNSKLFRLSSLNVKGEIMDFVWLSEVVSQGKTNNFIWKKSYIICLRNMLNVSMNIFVINLKFHRNYMFFFNPRVCTSHFELKKTI